MTCKDCVHYGVCRFSFDYVRPVNIFKHGGAQNCDEFHSLHCENCKFLVPCKIGDIAFAIRTLNGRRVIRKGKVSEMFYVGKEMKLCIVVKGFARGTWGKDIFGTLEEAERHLEGEKS